LTAERAPAGPGRIPGVILVFGWAVFSIGVGIAFLAPSLRDEPPFLTDDVASAAAAIAGNPVAWQWALGLILAAAVITTLGLVPISLSFPGPSGSWAIAGLVTFAMAATLSAIGRLVGIGVVTWVAPQYPDPTALAIYEAFSRMRTGAAFVILAFIAVSLYGTAMTLRGTVGLGRLFLVVGVLGVLLQLFGAAIPVFVYITTAALGAATWRLGSTRHADDRRV
jgi:hypothetical protein